MILALSLAANQSLLTRNQSSNSGKEQARLYIETRARIKTLIILWKN